MPTETKNPFSQTAPNPFKSNNAFTIPMDNDEPVQPDDALPWERKAAEIEAKTRELKRREEEARKTGSAAQELGRLSPNWPPFYPLLVHRIDEEIPVACRHLVQHSYAIWKLTALAYLVNVVSAIALMGKEGYGGFMGILLAVIYLLAIPPLTFWGWHLSLYRAVKQDAAFWYVAYFCAFALQLVFYLFLAVGIFNGGGGGLLGMLAMLAGKHWVAMVISAICTALLVGCFLYGLYLIQAVGRHFRGQPSAEAAVGDAMERAATNPTLRNAVIRSVAK